MYTTTTLQQATEALSARLSDPGMVRWVQPELSALIIDALRTWNSFTGTFRDTGVFQTTPGEPFYDLAAKLPNVLGYTVTDADLVSQIEYHLLEPATPTIWTGSEQFTLQDLVSALQRRRDQFLLETGMVLTRTTQGMPPTQGGRQPLSQTVMTVSRAAWQTTDGKVTPLTREDAWAFNHFLPGWVQSPNRPPDAVPFGYSVGETPPLVLQIAPPNSDTGLLDLVTISRGPILDPSLPVAIGIPNDWTWVVKFGALSDLLNKDGLAADESRASYCEQRWQQGVQLAKAASLVWTARVNNVVAQIAALTEADDYDPSWQSTIGPPDTVLTTRGNIIALSLVPNGLYSVTLDVVRNAPVPSGLGEYLQVGEEVLDTVLDYAEHLALFKEGSAAIQASQVLLNNFMRAAGVAVSIDGAKTPNIKALSAQSSQDETHTTRMEANS